MQLGQERGRAEHLQRTVHQLEAEGRESAERVTQLSAKEKELADKTREQVGYIIISLLCSLLDGFDRNERFNF